MPMLKEDIVFELTRGIKAFLKVRTGFTRGEVPDFEAAPGKAETRTGRRRGIGAARGSAQFERGPAPLPYAQTPVFFLFGHGRSGTTWLQSVLDAHPEVMCTGEGWLFNRDFRREDFKDLHPKLKPTSLYGAIAGDEYLRLWAERSVWGVGEDADEHLDNLTRLAVNYFMGRRLARENARKKTDKRIVGDKTATPGPQVYGEIARIYPEAKVINIVRDGRDVAVSVMHFLWNHAVARDGEGAQDGGIYELEPEELERREAYRKDSSSVLASTGLFTEERLRSIARGWAAEVGEARRLGPGALGANYAGVRYEDLLSGPEEVIGRLLEFLGADDASEKAVRGCIEAAGFERLSSRGRGQEDSTSVRFRKGIAGDWTNVFAEQDKRIFKEEAGKLLVELGYEKDQNW